MHISIVVVYNNNDLMTQLKKSLKSEILSFKLFALDNTGGKYKSAASAFNYALSKADIREAEVIVFCHQDIVFLGNSLDTIYNICHVNPNMLIGAAGVKNNGKNSKIISSMSLEQEGWTYKTLGKGTMEKVFSLDECLIACNSKIFNEVKFDENVCNTWHLYVTDLCIQCHIKNIDVIVFDADILHLSHGKTDRSFYICERDLAKKWRKKYKILSYTCGWTYTNPILYWILYIYRKIKFKI